MESGAAESAPAGDPGVSFLLVTDICSAYLKNDQAVVTKVMLHFGGLHVSIITVRRIIDLGKTRPGSSISPARRHRLLGGIDNP